MARTPRKLKKRPIIMLSSAVYGYEDLIERMHGLLTTYGYEVWCSHMGTLPTKSTLSAFENCLEAVRNCDLFLGLITTYYGSGIARGEISITHQEQLEAIKLNKPRWLLAHDHVVFARRLLTQLGVDTPEKRDSLILRDQPKPKGLVAKVRAGLAQLRSDGDESRKAAEAALKLAFTSGRAFDDLRLIDMYEAAIQNQVRFRDRKGNWVQNFIDETDALRYATAQFYRLQEIEAFLEENLANPAQVMRHIDQDRKAKPNSAGSAE